MRIMINYSEQVSCMKSGLPDIFLPPSYYFYRFFFQIAEKPPIFIIEINLAEIRITSLFHSV